ncbi:DUF7336 domain-containing protein [Nocardia pseudovaccinii]|uniref:DUF7336 domain-containing protein n=1 Tax=Nocardia pseudovaccinii TaxID=189540 RepID=UPI0007A47AB7|nr:hypothetical protein [Nocardia pseudovaccinii]
MREIFILDHWYELENGEEFVRTVGMYSTESRAVQAAERMKDLPGFRDRPDDFHIDRYTVGKDHWSEGFFTP